MVHLRSVAISPPPSPSVAEELEGLSTAQLAKVMDILSKAIEHGGQFGQRRSAAAGMVLVRAELKRREYAKIS